MTYRELFEKALRALETNNKAWKHLADSGDAGFWEAEEQPFYEMSVKAITALRQAIEQAEQQEPVAWKDKTYWNLHHYDYGNSIPLYTSPPQRKPLTDEEIFEVHKRVDSMQYLTFARAIESKHGIGGGE